MATINCDLGESWDSYRSGEQAELLALCDLANVCCGAHAGDAELTRLTFLQIAGSQIRAGAHPGYPDREHFGRRRLYGTVYGAREIAEMVSEQVALAERLAREAGTRLRHVKPHGALYNEASEATDEAGELAEGIALGVKAVDRELWLVGLSGSQMLRVWRRMGFSVLREGFADRRYTEEGLLAPRADGEGFVRTNEEMAAQVERLRPATDTFCVHGDSEEAREKLRELRRILAAGTAPPERGLV
jgi:UPF0271 protein